MRLWQPSEPGPGAGCVGGLRCCAQSRQRRLAGFFTSERWRTGTPQAAPLGPPPALSPPRVLHPQGPCVQSLASPHPSRMPAPPALPTVVPWACAVGSAVLPTGLACPAAGLPGSEWPRPSHRWACGLLRGRGPRTLGRFTREDWVHPSSLSSVGFPRGQRFESEWFLWEGLPGSTGGGRRPQRERHQAGCRWPAGAHSLPWGSEESGAGFSAIPLDMLGGRECGHRLPPVPGSCPGEAAPESRSSSAPSLLPARPTRASVTAEVLRRAADAGSQRWARVSPSGGEEGDGRAPVLSQTRSCERPADLGGVLVLPLPSRVASGRSLHPWGPQFPHPSPHPSPAASRAASLGVSGRRAGGDLQEALAGGARTTLTSVRLGPSSRCLCSCQGLWGRPLLPPPSWPPPRELTDPGLGIKAVNRADVASVFLTALPAR